LRARSRAAASAVLDEQVLGLLGIAERMAVLDVNAAGGRFAERLAQAVGPRGRVIAHNDPGARAMLGDDAFERRYGGNRLPNVEQLFAQHNDIDLPAASLDAVLMSLVYHDTYWHSPSVDWGPVNHAAFLERLFDALVPGGVVGVIDHRAAPGADPYRSAAATHRIDPAIVACDFTAAGFALHRESDLFAHPDDDPASSIFDEAVRGRTDRFFSIFKKPR
jgi:predicted methyltransferase